MNSVVLIGRHDDSHVPHIVEAMAKHKLECKALVLGGAEIPRIGISSSGAWIEAGGTLLTTDDIHSASLVLYLPFAVNDPPLFDRLETLTQLEVREWRETFQSIILHWHRCGGGARWPISPEASALQARKLYLLSAAAQAGVAVPEFLASNCASDLRPLAHWKNAVAKCPSAWQEIAEGSYFNTTRVPISDVADSLTSPWQNMVLVQEEITCEAELRLFAIGSALIGVEQTWNGARDVDIRVCDRGLLQAQVLNVGGLLAESLLAVNERLGLDYCCFDVLRDTSGGHWLVDVNPTGTWQYLLRDFDIDVFELLLSELMRSTI